MTRSSSKFFRSGGDRDIFLCPCGYRMIGNKGRMDIQYRLHCKVCPLGGGSDVTAPSEIILPAVGMFGSTPSKPLSEETKAVFSQMRAMFDAAALKKKQAQP